MTLRLLCVAAMVGEFIFFAGCGDDAAPAKFASVDSFCSAKAEAECKAVASACGVATDACKTQRTDACNTAAGTAAGQGRTYQQAKAEACITKTTEVYADRTIDPVKEADFEEACGRVFAGSKKKSEACDAEFECEETLICDPEKKVCAEKVERKADDPCNNPGDVCGKDLYCQQQGDNKFCVAKNKLDESCRVPSAPCAEDGRCVGNVCVARLGAGEACDSSDECTTNFCNAERKCQARQYASETGSCKDFGA
jgi:hypothetical protein